MEQPCWYLTARCKAIFLSRQHSWITRVNFLGDSSVLAARNKHATATSKRSCSEKA